MRNISILLSYALCVSMVAFGQMKVQPDGRIVVNPSGVLTSTQFTLNTDPLYPKGFYVKTAPSGNVSVPVIGLESYSSGLITAGYLLPREVVYSAGVIGKSSLQTNSSGIVVSMGVIGKGDGSSQGRNIGVLGYLRDDFFLTNPTVYGAGVFGTVNFSSCALNFSKSYAGYFAGDVEITTSLKVNTTTYTSDFRYKQNIMDLRQAEIDKVYLLNPVEYNLKQRYNEYTDAEGNQAQAGVFDENSELFQKKHYGLIAQELREVYPDLVYEDPDGYLSVDYIGIIPLLISSVKELNAKIDVLERELNSNAAPNNAPARPQQETEQQGITNQSAALYQNTPNPFNENTEIAFYLPQSVTNAMLCVYDMNGRQLSQNIITQRGSSVFVVNGSQYGAGMYLYSLIADNQIVDTKRMILTK